MSALERALERSAHKELLPMQPGDVPDTHADVKEFFTQFNYLPDTPMQSGIEKFVAWYLDYYNVRNS